MPTVTIDDINTKIRKGHLKDFFVETLNWERALGYEPYTVSIAKPGDPDAPAATFRLTPIVEKRGIVLFQCSPGEDGEVLGATMRRAIDKKLTGYAHEHLIVFHDDSWRHQVWQYTDREPGKPLRPRTIELHPGQSGESLRQFMGRLSFDIEADEHDLTLIDVLDRIRAGIPADTVTKNFYTSFSKERDAFESFIEGIAAEGDRRWYASIMLNRLMFIWFIQSKGFLDSDPAYLTNRFRTITQRQPGTGTAFISFYRAFLRKLFDEGLDTPTRERTDEITELLGNVPYLNGGIFDKHTIERSHEIDIPDEAFERLFVFFGQYQWHLDDSPLATGNEINPDVIGYIFEKFVNQKEKGAYYTKEDVTGYISQNTILPWILDQARRECAIAFRHDAADNVWTILRQQPDDYIYPAMKHGVIDAQGNVLPMPDAVAPGIDDVSQRGNWNTRATEPYALPTETWREYVHRRRRTLELRKKLASGEVHQADHLITYNLDIRQFAQDIVEQTDDPAVLRAMYKAVANITVLDPTCGSGAFLFAALEILHPLHDACLEKMRELVDDLPANADPKKMQDFRDYLAQVKKHPNKDYFILRQIVLNNLHGVDIEEEAVEICKIRLFLTLVSKLNKASEIEPLPDIDFNIRAGNTLVGYVTEKDIQIATGGGQMSMDLDNKVADIRERAELADKAYQHFKRVQVDDEAAVADMPAAKAEYRQRLDDLRDELDGYLHRQQAPGERRESWRARTQPFHWFVEFHGAVVNNKGFDAVIGNPPYVRARDVRKHYSLSGFKTDSCPDIYAMVLERSTSVLEQLGRLGMIVPLSVNFSGDFKPLRKVITDSGSQWFASFDNIPAALFSGVSQRCTIVVTSPNGDELFTTGLRRWRAEYRDPSPEFSRKLSRSISPLLATVHPVPLVGEHWGANQIPMLTGRKTELLLTHIVDASPAPQPVSDHHRVGFSPTARNFVSAYLTEPPLIDPKTLEVEQTTRSVWISTPSIEHRLGLYSALVSEIGFWYWLVVGDGFDVTKGVITKLVDSVCVLHPTTRLALASIGHALYEARANHLVFKLNSGKYVGNYNFSSADELTRRATMLFVLGSGFSAATGQTVIDTVERILSINEHAGEKGIPAKVREAALEFLEQEPPITFDTMSIPEIDAHIDELRSGASARAKVG